MANLEANIRVRTRLNKNLHTTPEAEDQVKSRFLLYVVIRKGTAILKLLSSKDQTLLVWRDPLLILDLILNIVDGVG